MSQIGTTRAHWFVRGGLVGVLVGAVANSLSYFVRSGGWGGTLGRRDAPEAIGFPLEIWSDASRVLRLDAVAVNGVVLLGVALACGLLVMAMTTPLNRLVREIETELSRRPEGGGRLQFSLKGLLQLTVVAAMFAAMVRRPQAETLAAIYLLGPGGLVLISLLPRGISWRQRVWILTPLAALLIGLAIVIGMRMPSEVDFEKVLMGIAVSWTSQSAAAAILLTLGLLIWRRRTLFPHHA